MVFRQKKICLIFCAEAFSIGLKRVDQKILSNWVRHFPGLDLLAKVKPFFICQKAGLDVTWQDWQNIAQFIKFKQTSFDGFVVVHSPDNILYGANLVSCILGPFKKPVILAPVSADDIDERVRNNFFGDFISLGIGNSLFNSIQAVCSRQAGVFVAEKGGFVRELANFCRFGKRSLKIEPDIKIIEFYPGQKNILAKSESAKGFVLKGGSGVSWPKHFEEEVGNITLPVLVWGLADKDEINSLKKRLNFIISKELTFEAAISRFVWALGQTRNASLLRKYFDQ